MSKTEKYPLYIKLPLFLQRDSVKKNPSHLFQSDLYLQKIVPLDLKNS